MQTWRRVMIVVGASSLTTLIFVIIVTICHSKRCWRRRSYSKNNSFHGVESVATKITSKWRESFPFKPFEWAEHPSLIEDTIDRGWAAFAFMYNCTSQCPTADTQLGHTAATNAWQLCTKCSFGEAYQPENSWEIGPGAEFMQLMRMNPKLKSLSSDGPDNCEMVQALQSSLPLPGPWLGSGSFPQEAYFEITILAIGSEDPETPNITDSDGIKLILQLKPSEKHPITINEDGLVNLQQQQQFKHNASKSSKGLLLQEKLGIIDDEDTDKNAWQRWKQEAIKRKRGTTLYPKGNREQNLAVGWSAGVAPPFRFPGSDPGSIGFHSSNGRITLNGVSTSSGYGDGRSGWGNGSGTVGCGFNLQLRKFYFTLDGEIVAEEECKCIREFSNPMYAVIASNYDVTMLINFGQCSFEYLAANAQRISDPNKLRSLQKILKAEGSGDLFSIRRLDSRWSSRKKCSQSQSHEKPSVIEAESDLFEITLDKHKPPVQADAC